MRSSKLIVAACLGALVFGCEDSDPTSSGGAGGSGGAGAQGGTGGAGAQGGAGAEGGAGGAGAEGGAGGAGAEGGAGGMACEAAETDYIGAREDDGWNTCVSDAGTYQLAGESAPSSIARIASFETIADLLWRGAESPSAQAFLDARIEYSIDQGLDSRVSRRYDARLDRPAEGIDCRGETHGMDHPDYCVGPGQINPILAQAFGAGSEGTDPLQNAARVEAGLLWFMHVSTYKEAYSCKDKAKDCDSAWAYYGAGEDASLATGLAAYVKAIEPATHASMFNAIMGVRCWRDLDNTETAMDAELHQRVLGQLDRALNRVLTILLIDRLNTYAAAEGDAKMAAWAFLKTLGPVLDRAARAESEDSADALVALWASDGENMDHEDTINTLNSLFPCP